MKHERRDDEVWLAQRDAQRRMSVEDRLRQNDAMSRLRFEAAAARKRANRA